MKRVKRIKLKKLVRPVYSVTVDGDGRYVLRKDSVPIAKFERAMYPEDRRRLVDTLNGIEFK